MIIIRKIFNETEIGFNEPNWLNNCLTKELLLGGGNPPPPPGLDRVNEVNQADISLVVFHLGCLQFWSSSILVIFHFGRLPTICLPFVKNAAW